MALTIEKEIDLTASAANPDPKVVKALSIIHEATDGELVQYYIDAEDDTLADKNTHAIGVYDEQTREYSYHDYEEVVWESPKQRICGNRVERFGVKAFPNIGAIAFYKLAFRNVSRIVAPVNKKQKKIGIPVLSARINQDNTVTFTITPPLNDDGKEFLRCYRIVMRCEEFSEDHITYDLEVTVGQPQVSGIYECYVYGYPTEGQERSKDSNVLFLELTGKAESYEGPYYKKSDLTALFERIGALEEEVLDAKALFETVVEVENAEP